MNEVPPLLSSARKSWIERHLAWFIAGVCAAALALLAGSIALVMNLVVGSMRESAPYAMAMATVRADPVVRDALGAPIHERWFMGGHINIRGEDGDADFVIPITAPKGKAMVRVLATRLSGVWYITALVVEIPAEKERINLLEEEPAPRPPSPPEPVQPQPPESGPAPGTLEI